MGFRLQAVKSLKKQAEKAKKKQDTAARQADLKVKLGEMSEQERAEWAARRKEVRQVHTRHWCVCAHDGQTQPAKISAVHMQLPYVGYSHPAGSSMSAYMGMLLLASAVRLADEYMESPCR